MLLIAIRRCYLSHGGPDQRSIRARQTTVYHIQWREPLSTPPVRTGLRLSRGRLDAASLTPSSSPTPLAISALVRQPSARPRAPPRPRPPSWRPCPPPPSWLPIAQLTWPHDEHDSAGGGEELAGRGQSVQCARGCSCSQRTPVPIIPEFAKRSSAGVPVCRCAGVPVRLSHRLCAHRRTAARGSRPWSHAGAGCCA